MEQPGSCQSLPKPPWEPFRLRHIHENRLEKQSKKTRIAPMEKLIPYRLVLPFLSNTGCLISPRLEYLLSYFSVTLPHKSPGDAPFFFSPPPQPYDYLRKITSTAVDMESQALDTRDVERIEKSAEEVVAKVDELSDVIRGYVYVSTWSNPLPAIRDELLVGLAALNRLRAAHQSALNIVKTEENTVKQANEIEKRRLSDKQAELDHKAHELKEWERNLDKREGGLDATETELGVRKRNLDARQSKLDQDAEAHFFERGRLAEREDHLKTAEAEHEQKKSKI